MTLNLNMFKRPGKSVEQATAEALAEAANAKMFADAGQMAYTRGYICVACGSLCHESSLDIHRAWHDEKVGR